MDQDQEPCTSSDRVGDADRVEQEWAAKTSPDQQPGLSFILVDSLCQGITPHPGAHGRGGHGGQSIKDRYPHRGRAALLVVDRE
jgi:hypothetical protein